MSTLSQNITQAITDFDSIKSAIQNKGVSVPSGTSTSQYASKINSIQTGITPAGTIQITQNGTTDVTNYASANVAVPQPSGTISITSNGNNIDVSQYASANVNVSAGGNNAALVGLIDGSSTTFNIPSGTTTIRMSAFRDCVELTTVTIPNTVTSIRDNAFDDCQGLTSVNIPSSLQSLGEGAFRNCNSITSYDFSNTSITSFLDEAFQANESLTTFAFPSDLEIIGTSCFELCDFSSINLLNTNIQFLGEWCFSCCRSLATVYLPDTITDICPNAFADTALTDIYYTGTQEEWNEICISDSTILHGVTIHYNYNP